MMKIDDLKLKQSYRAMMLWEAIYKQPFNLDGSMMSLVVFLWCIIEVNNPGTIGFEDFLTWIDDNPAEFDKLCKWLTADQKRQAELMPEGEAPKKSKKKATREAPKKAT